MSIFLHITHHDVTVCLAYYIEGTNIDYLLDVLKCTSDQMQINSVYELLNYISKPFSLLNPVSFLLLQCCLQNSLGFQIVVVKQ